jgi:AraC-like DNA-binding protein
MGLEYREYNPAFPLSKLVERFWTLQGDPEGASEPERILPDGRCELVWNLAEPFVRHRAGGAPRRQASSLLVGQITGPLLLEATGRIDLVGVRFRAGAFGSFLGGIPSHELTDQDFALEELLGRRLRFLADELESASEPGERIRIVERRISADLHNARATDRRVDSAVAILEATHGTISIDALAASTCTSGRHLERLFLSSVGIGPKRLGRILRFQRLVSSIRANHPPAWTRIALQCGYYDQAHLIRDFREFTGGPPGAFPIAAAPSLTEVFLTQG